MFKVIPWSESIAVGSLAFVQKVKKQLGVKAKRRHVIEADGSYALREPTEAYDGKFSGENETLKGRKQLLLGRSLDHART